MPSLNVRQHKVGKTFESAIRSSGLTRTHIANELGVCSSTFSYWYKRGVSKTYAQKTADILDIDVKAILNTHRRPRRKYMQAVTNDLEPRTVNIELLTIVAKMRLSAQQEATLHSLALTFLGEES